MAARVCDQFTRIIVRAEAGTLWIFSKGKLQQAHSWKAKIIAESFDPRSDHTEIFGNKWQLLQFSLQNLEKIQRRGLLPTCLQRPLRP